MSWDMAVQFCNALSLLEGLDPAYTIGTGSGDVTWNQSANGYRLPTEAEWEYACRATTTLAFHNDTNCLSADTEANYNGPYPLEGCPAGIYRGMRTDVGTFPANQWGLHDMHGNLWEWVWCGAYRQYTASPVEDPVHDVDPGVNRVVRGGHWNNGASLCRSAGRRDYGPGIVWSRIGFRPVRSAFYTQLGTIHIDPKPGGLDAPWELAGPDNYLKEGSGAATLIDMVPGDYTISWGEVDGWDAPVGQAILLEQGGVLTFTGVYTETDFVYLPPGTFMMGSPSNEPGRYPEEGPQHQVTLTQGFYMSQYEVTEARWHQVMGGTPANPQFPKSSVSWDMAIQFCNALSIQEGLTPAYEIHGSNGDVTWNQSANGYRLPTEAEWEYACRATTTLAFHNDTNCLSADTEANYNGPYPLEGCPAGIYRGMRTDVGTFPANQWGLHDMHGNLWEWVWCGAYRQYTASPVEDPVHHVGPGAGRVIRGGHWNNAARLCRSAARRDYAAGTVWDRLCFRPVRSAF